MEDALKELSPFIKNGARTDLKLAALDQILGILGDTENTSSHSIITSILNTPEFLNSLILSLLDSSALASKNASLILINMSAVDKETAQALVEFNLEFSDGGHTDDGVFPIKDNIVQICLHEIINPSSSIADPCSMILSNLTHFDELAEKIVDLLDVRSDANDSISEDNYNLKNLTKKLLEIFTTSNYNKHSNNFNYLGSLFSNLSQTARFRHLIVDKNEEFLLKLLPYTTYEESLIRRSGIVRTLRNICFEQEFHSWLLSEEINILSYFLLPLAGGEEFDEEDNDKLPIDLQYLPSDKTRESNLEIRIMLLESLLQLSCKRDSRKIMRDSNVYVILREYHKWEKDEKAVQICENLVNILVRTEEEIGVDNIKDIQTVDE